MGAFALATPVALYSGTRTYGALLLLASVGLALDRVYIGQHYPSDVLGGAILGAGVAWLIYEAGAWVNRALPVVWWPLDLASRLTDRMFRGLARS